MVVPAAEHLRLCALEETTDKEALEEAEDMAAFREWEARQAAGAPPI